MALLKYSLLAALAACSAFAADSSLLALLPPDAKVVSGMNVSRSAASPFGQFVLQQMRKDNSDMNRMMTAMGFDPQRDLTEVLATSPDGAVHGQGLILARGTFDTGKMMAAARLSGATIINYKDALVIAGKHNGWAAFADNQTLVAGDQELVKAALDRRGTGSSLDPKVLAKVNEVSSKYDAWAVSVVPLTNLTGKLPDPRMNGAMGGEMIQGIEQASGGVVFGSTIKISGDAVMRSEKDATALADVVRFLAGMAQANRDKPDAAKLAALLDSMTLQSTANVISISFSVPVGDLEQMIKPSRKAAVRKASLTK